ncbi:hypothetical protein GOBAR_AA38711 [Gossypium barbadense]|uniref:Uncharacterized protein n=1 Tax=Gossypium barbadense TaxID=3634 RepID=A0A2P5VT77_GOSBA|nr:hypothetical protein GOBAR_AA38711 [Gossypium barbadense]
MSEESSKQLKKRGQPNHFPTGNQKTNKRITDQKARLENRVRAFCFQEIVVKLTEAAPIVKQLLEAFSSINEGNLLQTVTYIRLGNIIFDEPYNTTTSSFKYWI